jgi:type I restriction enzyme M protein
VVVPEGLLFGSTQAHVDLRKKLIEEFDLLAVVSLPAGVFRPYAGVKTAILVFRRPAEGAKPQNNRVWFYEVANDGYDPDRITGGVRPETPEKNDIPDLLAQWAAYKQSGYKSPPGVEAISVLQAGSNAPKSWWTDAKTLAANDFNLAAGRYKPQISEAAPEEDPAELIREVLLIERRVAADLETLLAEMESVK